MLYFESCFQHLAGKKTQLSCERDRPPQVVDGKAAIDIGDVHGEVAISGARVAITRLLSRHAWELRNAVIDLQSKLHSFSGDVTEKMLEWYEVQKVLDLLPEEERVRAVQSSALQSVKLSHGLQMRQDIKLLRSADPLPASHDTKIRELWFRDDGHPKILPSDRPSVENVIQLQPQSGQDGGG